MTSMIRLASKLAEYFVLKLLKITSIKPLEGLRIDFRNRQINL